MVHTSDDEVVLYDVAPRRGFFSSLNCLALAVAVVALSGKRAILHKSLFQQYGDLNTFFLTKSFSTVASPIESIRSKLFIEHAWVTYHQRLFEPKIFANVRLFLEQFQYSEELTSFVIRTKLQFQNVPKYAIHYRGTDTLTQQYAGHSTNLKQQPFLDFVDSLVSRREIKFVASDCFEFFNLTNGRDDIVSFTDNIRSSTGSAIHTDVDNPSLLKRLAFEVVRDAYTLQKSEYLLCGNSNIALWCKLYNPSINVLNVNNFCRLVR